MEKFIFGVVYKQHFYITIKKTFDYKYKFPYLIFYSIVALLEAAIRRHSSN